MRVLILLCAFLGGFVRLDAESLPDGVVIKVDPPKITRRTFDPQNPPKDMPKLTPPEVGSCVYSFGCTTEVVMRGTRGKPARLSGVEVATRLTITLWTPLGGPAKILNHEEGHRAICEIYYEGADLIARELARREIGRKLSAAIRDKEAAEAELKRIQDALIATFMRETASRCDFAQARFDAITDHSMNPIDVGEAMTMALEEERAAYAQLHPNQRYDIANRSPAAQRSAPTRPRG
jgi:hypothetical protein